MVVVRVLAVAVMLTAVACASPRSTARQPPGERSVAPPSPRGSPSESIESLGDAWIGGFDPMSDDAGAFLRVDFAAGLSRLHPSEGVPPLGIIHPKLERAPAGPPMVHFSIDDGSRRRLFQLRRTSVDVLEGAATDDKGVSARAHLVHVASYDRRRVDQVFGGTYAIGGDPRRLLFIDDGALFDTADGTERRLFVRADQRAVVGSGVATAYPSRGHLTIDATRTLHVDGDAPLVATPYDSRDEGVRFDSAGATLQGRLLTPPGAGPHPVVVNVHGSGRVTRNDHWGNAIARVFLSHGYAVFLYDKRGVGDSGGEYVGRGGQSTNNVSRENLEHLASDAVAAASALAMRKDIDATRVGLVGISQAGWIVPLAAKKSKAVRFFILMSGPTVNTSVELAFSALVGDGRSCVPIEAADRIAHDHAPRTGFDPAPTIAALDVPGLWLYGAKDSSIPVPSSMRVLEPLRKKRDFEVVSVPDAGHELYRVRRDTEEERLVSVGISRAALDAIRDWLTRRIDKKP